MKGFLEDLGQKPLTPDVIREYLNQGCEKVKEFEPEAFLIVGIKAEGRISIRWWSRGFPVLSL